MTPWTVARQAPQSMGLSRQEHWSGLPCPPPGDLPDPGIDPTSLVSPALAGGFCTLSHLGGMNYTSRAYSQSLSDSRPQNRGGLGPSLCHRPLGLSLCCTSGYSWPEPLLLLPSLHPAQHPVQHVPLTSCVLSHACTRHLHMYIHSLYTHVCTQASPFTTAPQGGCSPRKLRSWGPRVAFWLTGTPGSSESGRAHVQRSLPETFPKFVPLKSGTSFCVSKTHDENLLMGNNSFSLPLKMSSLLILKREGLRPPLQPFPAFPPWAALQAGGKLAVFLRTPAASLRELVLIFQIVLPSGSFSVKT